VGAKRMFLIFLICGIFTLLVSAAFDREWPDHSAREWLVYVGGLVVIAVAFTVAERLVEKKRDQTQAPGR